MFFFLFYGQIFFKKTPTFLKIQVKSFSECFYQKVKVCVCVWERESEMGCRNLKMYLFWDRLCLNTSSLFSCI